MNNEKNNNTNKAKEKKIWVKPELKVISGLDSCVEFLYGVGGNQVGKEGDITFLP